MHKEEDAIQIMKNKHKLRAMEGFRFVFIDLQRSYQERCELFRMRQERKRNQAWTGSNAIPLGHTSSGRFTPWQPQHPACLNCRGPLGIPPWENNLQRRHF